MTNVQPASAETSASRETKVIIASTKTRITCAVCGGCGRVWSGTINAPCWTCNGKGYLDV